MKDQDKNVQAEQILSELIDEVSHIMMTTDNTEHAAAKFLLPWFEEDAENQIKRLKLGQEVEQQYLQRINNFMGSYSDNPPLNNDPLVES